MNKNKTLKETFSEALQNYKKGDLIFEDLFPYKERDEILFNPVEKEKFQQ